MEQNATEKKYPVAIFELIPVNSTGSGFVRTDTVNLPEDQQIRIIHPKNRVIMNESIVRVKNEEDGTWDHVPTRYIYNQREIYKEKQEAKKMVTSNRDKIVFINGFITMPKDGAYIGGYEFMMNHAQNESNPNRVESLQPIFREIKPEKQAQDKNVYDFQLGQCLGIINKLVKEKSGVYDYNEEDIDALAFQFGVAADSPAQKVASLIAFAKTKPDVFLETSKKSEQTVSIEIKHALQLNVIKIDGNAIVYTEGGSKIKSFSNAQNTNERKLSALGSYFQKEEGKEAYVLFKEKLLAAKEQTAVV